MESSFAEKDMRSLLGHEVEFESIGSPCSKESLLFPMLHQKKHNQQIKGSNPSLLFHLGDLHLGSALLTSTTKIQAYWRESGEE